MSLFYITKFKQKSLPSGYFFSNSEYAEQTPHSARLIWVCTACQLPLGFPEYSGLIRNVNRDKYGYKLLSFLQIMFSGFKSDFNKLCYFRQCFIL